MSTGTRMIEGRPAPFAIGDGSSEVSCVTAPKRLRVVRDQDPETLRSVATALDVLECFAADSELGVSDVARRLGVAKSSAHRLLSTLCSRGFTERNPRSGQYRLSLHLVVLGHLASSRNPLRHAAMPALLELSSKVDLTVSFSIPDGGDVVELERLVPRHGPHAFLDGVSRRLPAHCTSSGKAMAAFNADVDRRRRDLGFSPRVSRTVRSVAQWDAMLGQVRRRGFAMTSDESFEGYGSIGVPVFDRTRRAYAAVSVFGPTGDVAPGTECLVEALRIASRDIAQAVIDAKA